MRHLAYALSLSAFLLVAHAAPAAPQAVAVPDGRWLPWIGCWEGGAGAESTVYVVCFHPLADGSGVEIESHAEGVSVTRETVRADGAAAPVEEAGCAGVRRAAWSADGLRLFLSSEMACGSGVERTTRGTLTVLPEGRGWVEIHEVRAGTSAPLIGIRSFLPAHPGALIDRRISDPASGLGLATTTARTQASVPLSHDALVELVERAGGAVAGALIVERGEPFDLEARTLRGLAARGVPGEVLDVMVAMTYPERFSLRESGGAPEAERLREGPPAPSAQRAAAPWGGPVRASGGYSPWGFGIYDPFFFDPFYYRGGAYGYGYGGYPIGYPYYGPPRVIIVEPPVVEERSSVLSRNRGVLPTGGSTGSGSSSGGGSSAPAVRGGNPTPAPAPPPPPSGGSTSGGSSGDSGGGERRAVPRTGG